MSGDLRELGEAVAPAIGSAAPLFACGELTLAVERARVAEAAAVLRDVFGFSCLIDICGVDYPEREKRFDVVYHFLSPVRNQRLRLKLQAAEGEQVPSVVDLFPAANWYER